MLLAFVMSILMMILQLVLSIPQIIIVAMLSLQSPQLVLSVRLVMQLFVYGVVIWVSLRLSMAAPMTFAERKLRIFESWELTKGHTLSLLGVGFLISLIGGTVVTPVAIAPWMEIYRRLRPENDVASVFN